MVTGADAPAGTTAVTGHHYRTSERLFHQSPTPEATGLTLVWWTP